MAHHDPHRSALPHALTGAGHHGTPLTPDPLNSHHADSDGLAPGHPADAISDVPWESLWIDLGGEG
jgi:hypothetical protein